MALYVLSRERFSRIDHLHSLHNTLLALGLIASLVVAGYGVVVGLFTQQHTPCLSRAAPSSHHRDLKFRLYVSRYSGENSFMIYPSWGYFFACQTVTARNAMPQYTGPRKSEAVPLHKSPFAGS